MITGSVYYFTRSAIIFLSYHTVPVKRLPTEGASGHVSSGATSVKNGRHVGRLWTLGGVLGVLCDR